MSPKEQRIAIAKACRWSHIEDMNTMALGGQFLHGYPPTGQIVGKKEPLPDYLNDLNAMHEAEKTLTGEKWVAYWHYLFDIDRRRQGSIFAPSIMYMVSASATQRAEAFLKTITEWKDKSP